VLGHTGSGKTTLAKLLFCLYDPLQGCICIDDVDIRSERLSGLRACIGFVTQRVQIFHATVRENATMFDASITDDVILAALHHLGPWEWYQRLPDGLDTLLTAGGDALSAGEAQLLALARVFLSQTSLIVLDEATARLDPATERLIERALDQLLRDRTVILIAHRLSTMRRADVLLILQNGQICEYGTRAELERDPESHSPICYAPTKRRCMHESSKRPLAPGPFSSRPICVGLCSPFAQPALFPGAGTDCTSFFDRLTGRMPTGIDLWLLVALLVVTQAAQVATTLATYLSELNMRFALSSLLRKNLFQNILHHLGASALPSSPGEAGARLRDDVDQVTKYFSVELLDFFMICLSSLVALIILWRTSMMVTVVSLLPLLAIMLATHLARGRIDTYQKASSQASAEVTGAIGEMFGGILALKAAAAEDRLLQRFRHLSATRRKAALRNTFFGGLLDTLYQGSTTFGTCLVLFAAVGLMQTGSFSVGDLVLFVYYLGYVMGTISRGGSVLARYRQIGVAL